MQAKFDNYVTSNHPRRPKKNRNQEETVQVREGKLLNKIMILLISRWQQKRNFFYSMGWL